MVRSAPPKAGITTVSTFAFEILRENAIQRPSRDQAGEYSSAG